MLDNPMSLSDKNERKTRFKVMADKLVKGFKWSRKQKIQRIHKRYLHA